MAKKISKKTKNKVKKTFKRNPKRFILIFLILLVVVGGALYYGYVNGYLDDLIDLSFLDKNENEQNFEYSFFEQNEDGYYYYTKDLFNEGEYYHIAYNLEGDELVLALETIIREGFNPVSYGDARYVLAEADLYHLWNNENVRGIYDNDKIANYWIGTGEGRWQREHVWPNSKLGIPRVTNASRNQGSDLHNLRAITGINQTRSNRYFAAGSGDAKTVGTQGFYPGDEHKGDVARILFYMEIMYDVLSLTNNVSLLENDPNTNYTEDGAYQGLLDLLIEWHKEDPVDQFEMERNNFIYSGVATTPSGKEIAPQGNRNPFIDKPELVHLIWEGMTIEQLLKVEEEANEDTTIFYNNQLNIFEQRQFVM